MQGSNSVSHQVSRGVRQYPSKMSVPADGVLSFPMSLGHKVRAGERGEMREARRGVARQAGQACASWVRGLGCRMPVVGVAGRRVGVGAYLATFTCASRIQMRMHWPRGFVVGSRASDM